MSQFIDDHCLKCGKGTKFSLCEACAEERSGATLRWCDVVRLCFDGPGDVLPFEDLLAKVEREFPEKLARNANWCATVRRTLRQDPQMERIGEILWKYLGPA